jgi:serine/threonine protein kinase/dipeptidyl aminopeptidase/acylaminoacyl peptidase
MIGKSISHYKILEKLGEGGMGVVYKVQDTKLDRLLALKFLPPHLTVNDTDKARFIQEAKAASAINHNNVCIIHDIQEDDDRQFIVMEYVDGKTLRETVGTSDPTTLKIKDLIEYAVQIASALEAAHEEGIVHRDIKSENIMISKKNQIKVMDFGLAKLKGSLKLTKTSSTVGTLAYMAPEQIEGKPTDARSDIFSFGVVLYELLTGKLPFSGEYESALMYSIINDDPEPVENYRSDISSELVHVLNRSLEKDPQDRYQNMHDVLIDLNRVKRDSSKVSRKSLNEMKVRDVSKETEDATAELKVKRKPAYFVPAVIISILILVLFVFIAGKFGYLPYLDNPEPVKLTIGQTKQLTHTTGLEFDPVISPDGKMIAYAAGPADQMDIFVRQLSGGRAINLTRDITGNHRVPQWSPNGTEVAFSASQSGEFSSVKVVPALGGIPKKIVDLTANRWPAFLIWSPDRKKVAYVQRSEKGSAIYARPVGGGDLQLIAEIIAKDKRTDDAYAYSLSWSPDGAHLAYVTGNPYFLYRGRSSSLGDVGRSSIWIVPATGGKPVQVTSYYFADSSPVWTPDSKSLFFISTQGGGRDVYHLPLSTSGEPPAPPTRLTTGLNAGSIDLSSDGKRLVYSEFMISSNVWSIRIPSQGHISAAKAKKITDERHMIEVMDVSPDGQWLAFDSNRSGNMDIYKMPLSGGEIQQLTTHPADDFHPSWSPDGKEIAFYSYRNIESRIICLMSPDGGSVHQLSHVSGMFPVWSPDGTQIAYHSERDGQRVTNLISIEDDNLNWSSPRYLTTGWNARWAPNGHHIAVKTDSTVQVIAPKGGAPQVLIRSQDRPEFSLLVGTAWSQDSRTVYFMAADAEGKRSFWSIPSSGGNPSLLIDFDVPSRQFGRGWIRTHGDRLYFTITERESDIWVMDIELED